MRSPKVEVAGLSSEKQRAIEIHDQDAVVFDDRYRRLEADPYSSTFTYGRKKISKLLDREVAGLPKGAQVLDAGCGTGYEIARLASRGFSVVGLEAAESMLVLARKQNPQATIIAGDVENLPFPSNSFDMVIAIEVIRYFRNSLETLSEMARVTRPGGKIFVTAAPLLSLNGYALINLITSRIKLPTFSKIKHFFLTERRARRLMDQAGLRDIVVHGAFLGPWHPLGRLSPNALSRALRRWERTDDALADRAVFRDLSNHLIIVANKAPPMVLLSESNQGS